MPSFLRCVQFTLLSTKGYKTHVILNYKSTKRRKFPLGVRLYLDTSRWTKLSNINVFRRLIRISICFSLSEMHLSENNLWSPRGWTKTGHFRDSFSATSFVSATVNLFIILKIHKFCGNLNEIFVSHFGRSRCILYTCNEPEWRLLYVKAFLAGVSGPRGKLTFEKKFIVGVMNNSVINLEGMINLQGPQKESALILTQNQLPYISQAPWPVWCFFFFFSFYFSISSAMLWMFTWS